MRGQVMEIYKTFEAADRTLVVPVYQRNYDWRESQCAQLLEDLEQLAQSVRTKHFFGAIVGVPEGSWVWTVIDGQQRLTTVSLVMLALSHLLEDGTVKSEDPGLAKKIRRGYLVERDDDQKPRFKLKPVKDDAEAYKRLFAREDLILDSNITGNYKFFMEALPQTGLTGDQLWEAICGLEAMQLDLEKEKGDSPQRIFESLNSTGLALSEADKTRNLILMGLPQEQQVPLYEDYWNRVEKNVGYETPTFLRWYLVTRTGRIPRQDAVYEAFKAYLKQSGFTNHQVAADLRKLSEHYRAYHHADTPSRSVNRKLRRLAMLGQDVVTPFVLALLEAHSAGDVEAEDAALSLEVVESYLFRRFAASIPTNALSKLFVTLFAEVTKSRGEEDRFADVLVHNLLSRKENTRFPRDPEFSQGFLTRNLYSGTTKRRTYALEVLENLNSNDTRDIARALADESLSVEHIMPQTLTSAWRRDLGDDAEDIHATHLHRVGNLTVTAYNSKYSNSDYETKRTVDDGFLRSPYRLSEYLKETPVWGAEQVEERGCRLLADALDYWKFPSTSFEPVVVPASTEPMGSETDFTNRRITGFEFRDAGGPVFNWREMYVRVLAELARIDRGTVFEQAAGAGWCLLGPGSEAPKGFWEVAPGLSTRVENSTSAKLNVLRTLFERIGLDPDDLVFTLQRDSEEEVSPAEVVAPDAFGALREIAQGAAASTATHDSEAAERYVTRFLDELGNRRVEDPLAVLGSQPLAFARNLPADDALTEQLLALISGYIQASELLDPAAFWTVLSDGTVSGWLAKVAATPQPRG